MTLGIELSAGIALKNKADADLIALVNLMTNPLVVFVCLLTRQLAPDLYVIAVIIMETAAVISEGYVYKLKSNAIANPYLFSLGLNVLSYGTGLVINAVF